MLCIAMCYAGILSRDVLFHFFPATDSHERELMFLPHGLTGLAFGSFPGFEKVSKFRSTHNVHLLNGELLTR